MVAAIVAMASLALTIKCWARMGKDWRMAVTAEPDQPLITDGLFSRIRHPIYAFSIVIVLSLITNPARVETFSGAVIKRLMFFGSFILLYLMMDVGMLFLSDLKHADDAVADNCYKKY